MTKMNAIAVSLEAAEDWERKGEPGWVCNCLSSALMNYLSLAVEEHSSGQTATEWLESQRVGSLLQRIRNSTQSLADGVETAGLPGSALGGNYHYLVYAHLAWALRHYDEGEWFVAFSQRHDVLEISTPFWREYARAMAALVRREAYAIAELRLRGQERYWAAYLHFIEAASRGAGVSDALAEIDRAFAARNADRRIKDDHYEVEGSGLHPVRWDFRRDSLLAYVQHRR